ncbi:MAG TPA: c-type cytochrome [Candidatus Binatia bacterium]|nr:c-type cytochrome [Candidatus Binatia bacterium]
MADLLQSEEKRSYAAVFLLAVGLLLACTVWAIWQDTFSRHLWKKYKTDFYRLAIAKYEGEIAAERERLAGVEEYVALEKQHAEATAGLAGSGPEAARLDGLRDDLVDAEIKVTETDLDLRMVKGKIEEAWYELEHAQHSGESGTTEHARLEALFAEKDAADVAYEAAEAAKAEIVGAIAAEEGKVRELAEKLRPHHARIEDLTLKLDGVSLNVLGRRLPMVPTVEQVFLADFERNNFENWVGRVERCMNCHVAIDREGFEDQENPLKTHPDRKYYLGNHETKKFGCTPCHGGQGAAINSVEQAHGQVPFWEDPLLDIKDKAQAKCMTCHQTVTGKEGTPVVERGEWLFQQMGCNGCHLIQGYEDLPKAGPSLKRVAAKASPEWMVEWIENPRRFRPRTRMPHFFLSREQSIDVTAYLLSSSLGDARSWMETRPLPDEVDPDSSAQVEAGKKLVESFGCLGCHGFAPEQFASHVAVGMDTAPNLSRIAEKADARWIYHWISDPRSYSDSARMPRLRLSSEEAAAITSYLATLRQADTLAPDPEIRKRIASQESIDNGERLIRKYGCFGCHTINGMEAESRVSVELSAFGTKHTEELFFGDRTDIPLTWDDWTINKLLTPRTYQTERIEQAMPEFGFDRADARALTVFLASRTGHAINAKYRPPVDGLEPVLKAGREITGFYNCHGCHTYDGKDGAIRRYYEGETAENAPPILVKEGIKLQPEWFFDFLKRPMRLRPWLHVRMPTFELSDDEASKIVAYFAALDGYEIGPVVLEERGEAHTARHPRAIPEEVPVDCAACHPSGPGRVPDSLYSVSRKPLSAAEIAAWKAENLGIEGSAAADDPAAALSEFLGSDAR